MKLFCRIRRCSVVLVTFPFHLVCGALVFLDFRHAVSIRRRGANGADELPTEPAGRHEPKWSHTAMAVTTKDRYAGVFPLLFLNSEQFTALPKFNAVGRPASLKYSGLLSNPSTRRAVYSCVVAMNKQYTAVIFVRACVHGLV